MSCNPVLVATRPSKTLLHGDTSCLVVDPFNHLTESRIAVISRLVFVKPQFFVYVFRLTYAI